MGSSLSSDNHIGKAVVHIARAEIVFAGGNNTPHSEGRLPTTDPICMRLVLLTRDMFQWMVFSQYSDQCPGTIVADKVFVEMGEDLADQGVKSLCMYRLSL